MTEPKRPSGASETPLKPRCAIEAAVVGNRRFADETDSQSTPQAETLKSLAHHANVQVWRQIQSAMLSALKIPVIIPREYAHGYSFPTLALQDFFDPFQRPRLGVLSSLAAGADQIGARTAIECQDTTTVNVELEAVLPFEEKNYPGLSGATREEFREDEAKELRCLAGKACQVTRLDGDYENADSQRRAYAYARDVLLESCDLLIAIYDPTRNKHGIAGTKETVSLALSSGIPVVSILVAHSEVRVAIYNTPADFPKNTRKDSADLHCSTMNEWENALPFSGTEWRTRLTERIHYLLSIPHLNTAAEEIPGKFAEKKRLRRLAVTVHRLLLFYGAAQMPGTGSSPLGKAIFGKSWLAVQWTGRKCAGPYDFATEHAEPVNPHEEITVEPYARFYRRASDLSEVCMRTYRGALVLSFLLAGFAVAVAVSMMAVSLFLKGKPPLQAIVLLGITKITILFVLLALERSVHQERHHELAADFRYLAELLRPMQWLAALGTSVPAVDLPAHYAPLDPRQDWTQWLFRAVVRSAPSAISPLNPPSQHSEIQFDHATASKALKNAKDGWIDGQIYYHWKTAVNMHGLENGLERLAKGLLIGVILSAIFAVILEASVYSHAQWLSEHEELAEHIAIVLGALAAALPAFIAALGGIMFQSEAKRLRIRSEAMYHGLTAQKRSLFVPAEFEREIAFQTARNLRKLAGAMIQETSDWKALYPLHDVRAG